MAVEFKHIRVSQKFRRWLVTGVLILGIVPFVGVSLLPFLSGGETAQPPVQETTAPTPTPTIPQVSPAARQEELKGRVRGYEAILQQEPENQTALAELYVTRKELVQLGAGEIKDTLEPLEKLAQLNPNDLSLQLELGSIYAQQLRFEDAIAVYDNASKLNPQDFRPVLAKGIVLQLQGKKEEAKSVFATATNLAPEGFKEQVKAQIEQLTATPPNSTNAPAKDGKTQPATPASTSAPTGATPTTPASDSKAQPTAPTPESKSAPTNSAPTTPAGEIKTQPTTPAPALTPAPTNSTNAPASDSKEPVAPTPASSPSN